MQPSRKGERSRMEGSISSDANRDFLRWDPRRPWHETWSVSLGKSKCLDQLKHVCMHMIPSLDCSNDLQTTRLQDLFNDGKQSQQWPMNWLGRNCVSQVQNIFEVMSASPMYPALNCALDAAWRG